MCYCLYQVSKHLYNTFVNMTLAFSLVINNTNFTYKYFAINSSPINKTTQTSPINTLQCIYRWSFFLQFLKKKKYNAIFKFCYEQKKIGKKYIHLKRHFEICIYISFIYNIILTSNSDMNAQPTLYISLIQHFQM